MYFQSAHFDSVIVADFGLQVNAASGSGMYQPVSSRCGRQMTIWNKLQIISFLLESSQG